MSKKIRCCSCRGFFYYPPWWSVLSFVGVLLTAVMFLVYAKEASYKTEDILDLLFSDSSVDGVMIVYNGSWIATIAYSGTVLLALFIAVVFRLHQKIVKNYDFGLDQKYSKRYKFAQLLVSVGLIITLLGVLWMGFLVTITTLWYWTYEVIRKGTENLTPTSNPEQCSCNSCLDLSKYPFFSGSQCVCDPQTLQQINSLADDSRLDLILALAGACGLFAFSLLSLVMLATSLALITKTMSQLADRYAKHKAGVLDQQGHHGSAPGPSGSHHDEEKMPLKAPDQQFVTSVPQH